MKRLLQPATITALAGAVAILGKCYTDARTTTAAAQDAAWKRGNGMAFCEQAYMDLHVDVLVATNLTDLQRRLKGTTQ